MRTVTPERPSSLPYVNPDLPGAVAVDGFGMVGVSEFVEASGERQWVQLLPWLEYAARPDILARHATMARYLGALTTVDTPGIGPFTSNLTRGLRRDVARGNLKGVSEIQWAALSETTAGSLGPLSLLGYSMGTALTASFIREAPSEAVIERVVLVEPVADTPLNLGLLSGRLIHNSLVRADYRRTNPDWYRNLEHPFPPQTRELYSYATMIARGGQFDDVNQFDGLSVTLLSGEQSAVSPPLAMSKLARRLGAEQVMIRGQNHSFIDSLGNMAWLGRYLHDLS